MKLLIVDGELTVRIILYNLFKKLFPDFDCTLADNGHAAIRKIREEYFDLIVADHKMSPLSGVYVLIRAREIYGVAKARVILMTEDPETLCSEVERRLGREAAIEVENSFLDKRASIGIGLFKSKIKKIMKWQ
jgi:CheY-like chemotaxis protein